MNQEIKLKLEQAIAHYDTSDYDDCNHKSGFLAGAQTILENPEEWGLETTKEALTGRNRILSLQLKNTELQSQLAKYREVLERLLEENMCSHAGDELIEEALKQEVNND